MLVLHVLTVEEGDVIPPEGGQILLHAGKGVVFAAKANDQHKAGVGVQRGGTQQLFDVFVILPQLAAAELVGQGVDAVQTAGDKALRCGGKAGADIVDAAHGGDDEDLVADTGTAVGALVAEEGLPGTRRHGGGKIVAVLHAFIQMGGHVVGVYPLTGGNIPGGAADDLPILDDIFPGGDGLQRQLVTGGDISRTGQRDGDVIFFMNADGLAHSSSSPLRMAARPAVTASAKPG